MNITAKEFIDYFKQVVELWKKKEIISVNLIAN